MGADHAIAEFVCVECGCLIRADRQPKCPECAVDMVASDQVEVINGAVMQPVTETLKSVKSELHANGEWGININAAQYAIRSELTNDAAPAVPAGTFNAAKLPPLHDALTYLTDRVAEAGYPALATRVGNMAGRIERYDTLRESSSVCTTGTSQLYTSSPESMKRLLSG